ncbi:MAG: cyclic pyranopterin monophosphate synthase MoaC [Chloroflexi bacterium]|nr:MAG: cyclic pyranopterin monophosphate synthase MoaC [Chloroflexota bacterium]
MEQAVGQPQAGPLPGIAVYAGVVDFVFTLAFDIRLHRKQHLVKDRLRLRRRNPERRRDSRAKLSQHPQQLVRRIVERHQRAAVIEQHTSGVGHAHILIPVAKRLTHVDEKGAARMVDVADKVATVREATAECLVRMAPETVRAVREGTAKGDALQVARVAGIMAAKKTADLIPLCHPLPLTSVSVDFEFIDAGVRVTTKARVVGQTGVEMEALTAAAVAGLTLIDMTKGVERGVYLETVRLLEKSGGRSGTWKR